MELTRYHDNISSSSSLFTCPMKADLVLVFSFYKVNEANLFILLYQRVQISSLKS